MERRTKVLILSLASHLPPFDYIRTEGQEKTWDSIDHPGTETIYYFSANETKRDGKYLYLQCPDDYYMMHWRLKLALDYVWDMEWDYIFRTSASSYIVKSLLYKKALTLPAEKCYCGIQCCGGSVCSGCGFFMSRDVAQILREQIPFNMSNSIHGSHPDDVLAGRILEHNGIGITPGAERYDYYHSQVPFFETYHYRCKRDGVPNDGTNDVEAMIKLFNR